MSDDQPTPTERENATLADLRRQRSLIEERIDEHKRYLEKVAAFFSSSEEQQRIVSDIADFKKELRRIDVAIRSA